MRLKPLAGRQGVVCERRCDCEAGPQKLLLSCFPSMRKELGFLDAEEQSEDLIDGGEDEDGEVWKIVRVLTYRCLRNQRAATMGDFDWPSRVVVREVMAMRRGSTAGRREPVTTAFDPLADISRVIARPLFRALCHTSIKLETRPLQRGGQGRQARGTPAR